MKRNIRKWAFSLVILFSCYIVLEIVFTTLHVKGKIDPRAIWFHVNTDPDRNFVFDPVTGYRISSISSKMGCYLTNGTIETIGELKGNNYGFPDHRDFQPERKDSTTKRIAVFGDSFSFSQWTKSTWVEEAEAIVNANLDFDIQFMNFSIHGGGLANWWSIITRILEAEDFDLDAVIFCVAVDDVIRPFHSRDNRRPANNKQNIKKSCYAWSSSQDPSTYPVSWTDQDCFFWPRSIIIDEDQLEELKVGKQPMKFGTHSKVKPFLATSAVHMAVWTKKVITHLFRHLTNRRSTESSSTTSSNEIVNPSSKLLASISASTDLEFEADQLGLADETYQLINDVRDYLTKENLPVFTIGYLADYEVAPFIEILESPYYDASNFHKVRLDDKKVKHWRIRDDHHWTQSGVEHFANYVSPTLSDWMNTLSE